MTKINVSDVVAKHNAETKDGYQYVLISPQNVEFLEKIGHDNGASDLTVAANIALGQAAMAFDAYQARMRDRFAEEDANDEGTDGDRYIDNAEVKSGYAAGGGVFNIPGLGVGIGGFGGEIPAGLQEQLSSIFGGTDAPDLSNFLGGNPRGHGAPTGAVGIDVGKLLGDPKLLALILASLPSLMKKPH